MKSRILLFALLLFFASNSWGQFEVLEKFQSWFCPIVFNLPPARTEYPDDLLADRDREVQNLSPLQISFLNQREIDLLDQSLPLSPVADIQFPTFAQAKKVLESLQRHPSVNLQAQKLYRREDREIGYCFGRATYFHLVLLKMGVPKQAIKKVWLVGPLRADNNKDLIWSFHVATAVFTNDFGWVTLDTSEYKPQPVRHWLTTWGDRSLDKKPRLYVTDASKLNVQLGKYSRTQMGLDMSKDEDWFQGYFTDMLSGLKDLSLQDLDLEKLNP
jgi:hypothetical protein